jgi:hypothetical protein
LFCSAAWFMLVSCLAFSSTLKMAATCSTKMSVDFHQTAQHYIPEEKTFHTTAVKMSNCTTTV